MLTWNLFKQSNDEICAYRKFKQTQQKILTSFDDIHKFSLELD